MNTHDVGVKTESDDVPGGSSRGGGKNMSEKKYPMTGIFFSILKKIPVFLLILPIFVIVKIFVEEPRIIYSLFGEFKLTLIEMFYIIAAFTTSCELLKTARPGESKTKEVNKIGLVAGIYCSLFMLGTVTGRMVEGGMLEKLFSNTEFMILASCSVTQWLMASTLNGRLSGKSTTVIDDHHHD